jgi:hypothetical protein
MRATGLSIHIILSAGDILANEPHKDGPWHTGYYYPGIPDITIRTSLLDIEHSPRCIFQSISITQQSQFLDSRANEVWVNRNSQEAPRDE